MSWNELLSITKERRAVKRVQSATPPTNCPFDGEILMTEPVALGGRPRCKYCGWKYTGHNDPLQQLTPDDQEPHRSEHGPGEGWS